MKSQEEFSKNSSRADGLQARCKACQRQYQVDNKEHIAARSRAYRGTHKEEFREYKRTSYRNNPKIRADYHNRTHQRRAAYRETDITVEWLAEFYATSTHCGNCQIEFTYGYQFDPTYPNLDHIIPLCVGGTHTMDNVRYICFQCNNTRPKNGSDL